MSVDGGEDAEYRQWRRNFSPQLAETILELTGARCLVEVEEQRLRPKASEVERLYASSDTLRRLTGWYPKVPLREGACEDD